MLEYVDTDVDPSRYSDMNVALAAAEAAEDVVRASPRFLYRRRRQFF